ncbi:MAG: site-2 protease family protein [Thermoanaerobacterales bacterium]|nr:site-2 protease family protein [Bacillota bacterium]MDI6906473.1 site-2 protease family protein [Thermoanaerobacterales bacterium]
MKLGRFQGITLEINNWFLALLGVYFAAGVLDRGMVAFATVLLHELAHVWTARRLGMTVSKVELLPFGGVARIDSALALDPPREMLVAAAGPVSNLILIGLALGLSRYGYWHEELGPFFIQTNLLLFLFNLLPGLPLDGGRVARAMLARRASLSDATYRTASWGQVWGVILTLAGSAGVALHYCGLDIVATGLFLFYAARRERVEVPYLYAQHLLSKERQLAAKGLLPGEVLVARPQTPAWRVTRLFVPQRYHIVFLVDEEGRIAETLDETRVVRAVMRHGAGLPLGAVKEGFPE